MSKTKIARAEGVTVSSVKDAIARGPQKHRKIFEKIYVSSRRFGSKMKWYMKEYFFVTFIEP